MFNFIPSLNVDDFDYDLPNDLIANFPLSKRDSSKLMFVNIQDNSIKHKNFSDLSEILPSNSLLILNNTKVISARLILQKPSGSSFELLLIEKISTDKQSETWDCIVGGRKINEGNIYNKIINLPDNQINLKLKILNRAENYAKVKFEWDTELFNFEQIIDFIGKVPLPPYIKREMEESDKNNYQTVFAKNDGSIAAPTAGLHFTVQMLDKLKTKSILLDYLTLHVGIGTFLPMQTQNINEHKMHNERFFVNKSLLFSLYNALKNKSKIVAIGTTALRTIESLYWLGILNLNGKCDIAEPVYLEQWEAYKIAQKYVQLSPINVLEKLLEHCEQQNITEISGRTELFVVPGYEFKFINTLFTNFHLPKSTLIMLVAAFAGQNLWREAYNEAIQNKYRFLSYGDASLWMK